MSKLSTQKINRFICLTLFIILSSYFTVYSQSKYLIRDKDGFDFILNVDVDGNVINGYTRENALLDYASKFQFQLIKAATSLKYPEIIRFNGTLTDNKFEGTYDYLFSSYEIIGNIEADSISFALYRDNNELFKNLKGKKEISYTKKDYVKLTEQVVKVTEDNIFDPKIVQSKKWKEFKSKMVEVAPSISDDLEFQIGFFTLARKIGFSHYYITPSITSMSEKREKPSLKEITENTVILKIGNFYEKEENIKPLLDSIRQKSYKNLIIDIRDNSGGRFEPVLCIANFLTDKEFIGGLFPNREWYKEYDRLPNKNDLEKFTSITDTTQTKSKYGFYVSTKGTENNFKGNVYFLANKKTGSAAEAFIIGAKEYRMAKIIGQTTTGGLLNAKQFKIDENILLIVPVNDFISYGGYRVDQKGIDPDVETKVGKELEKALEIIKI